MSAPERLYARQWNHSPTWLASAGADLSGQNIEYIRADLYDQALRERDEARAQLAAGCDCFLAQSTVDAVEQEIQERKP